MAEASRARRAPPANPRRIDGRYRPVETLGEGGMGVVYRVVDESTGAELALKRLVVNKARSARRRELRFRREFHTMAGLRHPCIVRVFDYGVDADGPYYTLELLEGDLEMGDIRATCLLLRDVASALAYLHARRLLHRDIGVRNVRCAGDQRAKLIDFGVLATAGVRGEVVGTPPYVPPEALLGIPLDHRTDLYGLGALAYRLLTSRHAYPASSFDELPAAWKTAPMPPSAYRPEVTAALDELVMALLSRDPLARPAGAAEVIDKLDSIASLEPLPAEEVVRGWLQSAVLVGRSNEMARLRQAIDRGTRASRGRSVVIEGASGMGKSRLLHETGLEAQIAGATVLRASSAGASGPYALLRTLSGELLRSAGALAVQAARPHLPVIGAALPELRARAPDVHPAKPLGDPAEDRLRLLRALVGWFHDVSAVRPLVLLVDDVQRADEGSAAVLAALAHASADAPITIVAALRRGEPAIAPAAVAALHDAGSRIAVRGLPVGQVAELVRALFGGIPDAHAIAAWMHDLAGGCPLHCTELARYLVDRGIVRYDQGLWALVDVLPTTDVPAALGEAMRARVGALGTTARALGEALSVQGGELPLDLCLALGEVDDEAALFDALSELVFEEVLVSSGEGYAFRHDGLREALLGELGDDRRKRLHLRAAQALEPEVRADPLREAEVGWHYLKGGDATRGAELLERAGRALYAAHSFHDAVAPLRATLEVLERQGAGRRRCLELRHMLCRAGVLCDREVLLHYAEETIERLREDAGLATAARLRGMLGAMLAVALGIAWAALRHLFSRPSRRGPPPIEALTAFVGLVNYTASARSLGFQIAELEELVALVEPLSVFRKRILSGAHLMARNFLAIPLGRWPEVRDNVDRIFHILEHDKLTPLGQIDRQLARGAAHFMVASTDALDQLPRHAERLAALENLDLRFFEASVGMVRFFFHRLRGEEEKARTLWSETEMSYLQLGSAWVFASQRAWISSIAYGLSRDVLGLKQAIGELERLCRQGYRLNAFLELARGEYLRERGDLEASAERLHEALAFAREDESYVRQLTLTALAETQLGAGQAERARATAERALALASEPAIRIETSRLRAARILALSEAALGEVDVAARRLDELIVEAQPLDSPTVGGGLHEARARVALLDGDPPAYLHHLHRTGQLFRATKNPALLARLERLELAASELQAASDRRPVVSQDAVTAVARSDARSHITRTLGSCRGSGERAARALELLVDEAFGDAGYLFLAKDGRLEMVAPQYGPEPGDELWRRAERAVARALDQTEETAASPGGPERVTVVLSLREQTAAAPIGVAIVEGGSLPMRAPGPDVVERIARMLHEAGDATTMPSLAPQSEPDAAHGDER